MFASLTLMFTVIMIIYNFLLIDFSRTIHKLIIAGCRINLFYFLFLFMLNITQSIHVYDNVSHPNSVSTVGSFEFEYFRSHFGIIADGFASVVHIRQIFYFRHKHGQYHNGHNKTKFTKFL